MQSTDDQVRGVVTAPLTDAPPNRPWRLPASDLIALLTYIVIAGAAAFLSSESELVTPAWAMAACGIAGVAVVLLTDRHPRLMLATALALMVFSAGLGSGAEVVLVLWLLFRAGAKHSGREAWISLGAAIVVAAAAALLLALRMRVGPPLLGLSLRQTIEAWPTDWLSALLSFTVMALLMTLVGIDVGHRKRNVAALTERAEQMRRERDQQAEIARALERERIAREMHDVIAHSLAVMIALADGAKATVLKRPEEAQVAIGRVAETGRRTLGEVRRLLSGVREDDVESLALQPSPPGIGQIPALVDEFRAAGLPVRLERRGADSPDAVVGFTVYRIVQESLTNVLRHARDVRDVLVRISLQQEEVAVLVEDASSQPVAEADPGRGLFGIRERAAFYDGQVEAGPRTGGGWRVHVRLPLTTD